MTEFLYSDYWNSNKVTKAPKKPKKKKKWDWHYMPRQTAYVPIGWSMGFRNEFFISEFQTEGKHVDDPKQIDGIAMAVHTMNFADMHNIGGGSVHFNVKIGFAYSLHGGGYDYYWLEDQDRTVGPYGGPGDTHAGFKRGGVWNQFVRDINDPGQYRLEVHLYSGAGDMYLGSRWNYDGWGELRTGVEIDYSYRTVSWEDE